MWGSEPHLVRPPGIASLCFRSHRAPRPRAGYLLPVPLDPWASGTAPIARPRQCVRRDTPEACSSCGGATRVHRRVRSPRFPGDTLHPWLSNYSRAPRGAPAVLASSMAPGSREGLTGRRYAAHLAQAEAAHLMRISPVGGRRSVQPATYDVRATGASSQNCVCLWVACAIRIRGLGGPGWRMQKRHGRPVTL